MPWGAAIAAGATYLSSKSAKKSAEQQAAAGQAGIEEQRRQYEQTREDLLPYLTAGTTGVNRLSQALTGDLSGFYEDPGMQYALGRGRDVIESSAAARGSLLSGGTLKSLQEYGQNLANQQYGNYLNRLLQLANVGRGTGATLGQIGQGTSSGISNLLSGIGDVRAAGTAAQGQALNRGLGFMYGYGQDRNWWQ